MMERVDEYPHEKSDVDTTTVQFCSFVDLSAENTQV